MTDPVFGELRHEDNYGWWGKRELDFGGNICLVDILIHEDEDEITQRQRMAFDSFVKKWPMLRANLIEALIKYYNEERFSYGPENEEELEEWWPEIEKKRLSYRQ